MDVLASRDTTASTLTFAVYLLAMHPQVMTRLRQEILDKVGPIRMPNENDIKDMRYLRAVINGTYFRVKTICNETDESIKRDAETLPCRVRSIFHPAYSSITCRLPFVSCLPSYRPFNER